MLVVGLFLLVKGILDFRDPRSTTLVQSQGYVNLVFGGVLIGSSLSEFAVGAILISLAEMRTELTQSRRTLSAIGNAPLNVREVMTRDLARSHSRPN